MLSDGTYQRVAAQGNEWIESQMYFHQLACQVSEERVGMFGTIALKFDW
ncbi:hypothetical protein [Ammoniphilus sp. CFH 90114]|nr:hypothetical protein [Ammoniphilus sp. CFH 90114]